MNSLKVSSVLDYDFFVHVKSNVEVWFYSFFFRWFYFSFMKKYVSRRNASLLHKVIW